MSAAAGEMRVYFSHQDKHGLIINVDITKKGDVYIGGLRFAGVQLLKQSWHASGKGHVHTPGGRLLHSPKESPTNIQEPRRLWGAAPDLAFTDWTYRPLERTRRVNVSVDLEVFRKAPSWTMDIWALPTTVYLRQVLESYDIVFQHAVMDWTTPVILAVAWTMRPEAWVALERSIREGRCDKPNQGFPLEAYQALVADAEPASQGLPSATEAPSVRLLGHSAVAWTSAPYDRGTTLAH